MISAPGRYRRIAASYFMLQGIGTLVWWVVVALVPACRPLFFTPDTVIAAIFPADLLFYITGSLASAYAVAAERRWSRPAVWCTAGAVAYSTVHTVALSVIAGEAWIGTAMMIAAALASTALAVAGEREAAR